MQLPATLLSSYLHCTEQQIRSVSVLPGTAGVITHVAHWTYLTALEPMLRKLPSPHALAGTGCLNPSMLQDTFSLLSNRAVRDFLLSDDASLEIPLLHSPRQVERAIAASVDVASYETSGTRDVAGPPPFDYSSRSHWLMFPRISVGSYTLGVIVELVVSCNTPYPCLPWGTINTLRFVYDNASGELITIDHADGSDFVE